MPTGKTPGRKRTRSRRPGHAAPGRDRTKDRRQKTARPSPPSAQPATSAPAGLSLEAYLELERAFYLLRDALEGADSFEELQAELVRHNMPEGRVRQLADLSLEGDLHVHSNASDGKLPARKLPWLARVLGLRTLALTDHDSVAGCREAFREGMLLGVHVMPGVELSTEQPGLEILAYFPDAGKFFGFLASSRAARLRQVLERRQAEVHQKSLACLDYVNAWLRRQKVPPERLITLEEYDRWFSGQKPYFPGTLCVLGLERLSQSERARLKIHDPRAFNTRVVAPYLERLAQEGPARKKGPNRLNEALAIVATAVRAGVPAATILAHPKELMTKGEMSLGAVRKLVRRLAEERGLDGIEVACARDSEDDIRYWCDIVREYNAEAQAAGRKPLLAASHSSDFHVLAPGLATGEITMGFGLLDSRPQFRRGNLRPQMALDEFLEQLQRRACENVQAAGGSRSDSE
jgi:predicted metal-dependent phosphoesterase TrpH